MGQSVHAHVEVGDVHAHGLLAHGGLVGVTRRLVVIGEGDDGRAHACREGEQVQNKSAEELTCHTTMRGCPILLFSLDVAKEERWAGFLSDWSLYK